MATYNYKGTRITGTSTSEKVFKKSGIKGAKVNQTYFNTAEGHVYVCKQKGDPSEAKWAYVRTDIAAVPPLAVGGFGAPVRGNNNRVMTANWKVWNNWSDSKNGKRAQGLIINWFLGIEGKDPKKVIKTGTRTLTTSSINLDSLVIGSKTWNRQAFYPNSKKHLFYVTCQVIPFNDKGNGKAAVATRKFGKPRKPSISAFSFNGNTGQVTCTITTNAGADYFERYDTKYKVTIRSTVSNKKWTYLDTASTSTSIPIKWDAPNYQALGFGDYYEVTVSAFARGYAGNSETVTKRYYVAYPNAAVIKSVSVSSKSSTGKLTAKIDTKSTTYHPTDQVKLEVLADVEYSRAGQIPATADWRETGAVDNGSCTALTCSIGDLMPGEGKYSWLRVKSWHANEAVLLRYSAYYRIKALETPAPTAADEEITILSATAGGDGKSIVVLLGWNKDGTDDATGTELTWADEEDTWKSTESPKAYTFDWSDGPVTYEQETYQDSATITIKGLGEGEKYYIRARRYLEADVTTYSPYSNTATAITSETPDSITAVCDRYVATGSSLDVRWVFSSTALQTSWQIVSADGTVIANGEGSIGTAQISAERLAEFATDGSITFTVQASTGSGYVISEEHTVTIITPPTLEISAESSLTAQPFGFNAQATTLSDLVVICTSQGAVGQFPTGVERQTEGDTIYSEVVVPIWWPTNAVMALTQDAAVDDSKTYYVIDEEGPYYIDDERYSEVSSPVTADIGTYYEMSVQDDDGTFSTVVTFPAGLEFWDLGNYTLSVVAVDRSTGLKSDEQGLEFGVAWSHQAVAPDAVITPVDEIDEGGWHHQAAQIQLIPPSGAAETDVYDIYRLTGDGAILIGESFPLDYTAQDEYAPFGSGMTQHYRIALRTADGDVDFADFEYVLESETIRFDWSGGTLELPYSIQIVDSYSKDVDFRNHMDGGVDGYWNSNIQRKGKLNSDVIRLIQQSEIDAARQLARYPGAVFVRTADGSAYEADVQVTDLSRTNPEVHAVAFDATEIDLTQEFSLPTPYPLIEEGE